MDQLIINITNLKNIKQGSIVTLIGNEKISAENIAYKSNTITNELLSRLSNRLEYIYKN